MPVIVVGADTPVGLAVVQALLGPGREVRAFVSDPDAAGRLRAIGVKAALGDLSDDGHLEAAATRVFTAVLIAEAASDGRELAFAGDATEALAGWARAITAAGVTRAIWVMRGQPPSSVSQTAVVDPDDPDLVGLVVDLDDAQTI
ncbi:MAG: NmrA family NAD(P)-binding protein [Actinobacteria bacterium]|nr:NmrA family NAD(P)-binding protein [Actinomycetota bacterium]MCI0544767.1 NmrA family NAD(P)-binding protein [Actinomycetota bacterium]MCI0678324.1 NmrA family NAD(P)-binding protein [Actinomycetota bacterium]